MAAINAQLLSVGLAKAISLPLGFVASVLLARFMGPEVFGEYVFAFTVLSLLALPAGSSLGQLVMREVARATDDKDDSLLKGFIFRCWQWIGATSVLILLFVTVVASISGSYLILAGGLLIPLMAAVTLVSETLRGRGLLIFSQWPDLVLRPVLFLGLVVVIGSAELLSPQATLWAYTSALLGTLLVMQSILVRRVTRSLTAVPRSYDDAAWGKAIPWFFSISVTGALLSQMPIVITGTLGLPAAQISALQLALSFSLLVGVPMVVINLVMGPELAQLLNQKIKDDALRLSSKMTRIGVLLSSPLCIAICIYPEVLIGAVYGPDFVYASSVIMLLALSSLTNIAFGPLSYLLTLSGYERQALIGQVVGLLLMVFAVLLMAAKYGAIGSVSGVFAGTLVRNVVLGFMSRKYLGAPWSLLVFK